jgi:hypothetical protein
MASHANLGVEKAAGNERLRRGYALVNHLLNRFACFHARFREEKAPAGFSPAGACMI